MHHHNMVACRFKFVSDIAMVEGSVTGANCCSAIFFNFGCCQMLFSTV